METQEQITVKPANSQGERGVFLHIPNAKFKKHRFIGYIKNRTFFTFRDKSKNTFHKIKSIGINHKLLKQGSELFDFININYGFDLLKTSREFFLNRGFFLHFKSNGLERQIFLKIEDFGLDKAKEYENKLIENLNKEVRNFGNVLKIKAMEMQEGLF